MPYVRFVAINAEFEDSETAEKVLSAVIQQFRGAESAGSALPPATEAAAVLPPPAAAIAPTAAPAVSSRAVAETDPPPRPAAKPGLPRKKRVDKAAASGEASPAGAGAEPQQPLNVTAAIRQVLKGAGSLSVEGIVRRVQLAIAPRTTSRETVGSICAQLAGRDVLKRVGDGVYALNEGK